MILEHWEIRIEPAPAAEVLPLRHSVLRAGLPFEAACFAGDDDPASRHFVARAGDQVVACVTLHRSVWEGEPAWQLRGMAVDPDWQGRGLGRRLLEACDQVLRKDSIRLMWCNARKPAIPFYERHGWKIVSEEFEIPTAGTHRRMVKRL